jgi:hypothetical protein
VSLDISLEINGYIWFVLGGGGVINFLARKGRDTQVYGVEILKVNENND